MTGKRSIIMFLIFVFLVVACDTKNSPTGKGNKEKPAGTVKRLSAEDAVLLVAGEYSFDPELLKYEGIEPKTKFYIINLSPDEEPEVIDGVRKDIIYVDPDTSRIINPYQELLNKKLYEE